MSTYPSARKVWTLVVLLTLAYILSFTDRYILGLLIQPIKADLKLTDEQIGLIMGPAFALIYATAGLPLGLLVDRARRTWIVASGIIVWSCATVASGFANSFSHLFVARMVVGAGESVLSPAAFSMIADSFPPEKRGRPVAFYTAALTIGAGLASLIGASVLVWTKNAGHIDLPVLGSLKPWQMIFMIVGLPGVLISLGFLFVREPARQTAQATDPELTGSGLKDTLAYVAKRWQTFASFASLICVMTIIAYSQGFLAPAFERTWGWKPEVYALWNGIAILLISPATVNFVGWLCDRGSQRGVPDTAFRLLVIGYLAMIPTAMIPLFMPNPQMAFAVLCLNTVALGVVSSVSVTALLAITPAPIRGQLIALYYMTISLTGLFLGPTTVGFLSTRVYGEAHLAWALATLPALYGLVPLILIPVTRRLYLAQMARLLQTTAN